MNNAQKIAQIQTELSLSGKQTFNLARNVRYICGSRFSIESGLKKKLMDKDHKLETYFDVELIKYAKIEKKIIQEDKRIIVLCKNVPRWFN